ncbi:MAG: Fe-S cluster assembly protein SufD [Bacteroidetes bacterium 43-16]|nr:MAG: Fe-S cluster assembly protein SufD [Bacteroidetes bacterium 43-16]
MTKQLESPLFESLASQYDMLILQNQDSTKTYRTEAMEAFRKLGFPSVKNEEWRFTNILPVVKTNYELPATTTVDAEQINKAQELISNTYSKLFAEDEVYRLVLINGVFVTSLSRLPEQQGVHLCEIKEATEQAAFQEHFGKILNIKDNAFAALNSAMYQDGVFISVEQNVIVEKPIHIIKVILAEQAMMQQSRDLFVVGKSAALNVVESYLTDIAQPVFLNAAAEVVLAENATFNHYDIQKSDANLRIIQRTEAAQKKHSNYSNYTFTLPGASFVRNNLALHLNDDEVQSHLYGLYLTADSQLVDNHTEVHHKMPRGESNQLYKGIVMDKSKAVFNGKIFVYEDAQKTNAFQQSNNVLFSEQATVNAKPQLEIFADDVKCSHGTTIGQLNKEALFYLKSRGIGETQAKQLMVKAFAFDVAEKIQIPALRSYVEGLIETEMESR